jgi:hypothetical protein
VVGIPTGVNAAGPIHDIVAMGGNAVLSQSQHLKSRNSLRPSTPKRKIFSGCHLLPRLPLPGMHDSSAPLTARNKGRDPMFAFDP